MDLATRLKSVGETIDALVKDAAVPLAHDLVEFLNAHPRIKAFGWVQYTPYFNDGDECVFGVHELYVSLEDERGDSFYDEGWKEVEELGPGWKNDRTPDPDYADLSALAAGLQSNDEVMRAAFGNHVSITVDKDGVHVDEYEHD